MDAGWVVSSVESGILLFVRIYCAIFNVGIAVSLNDIFDIAVMKAEILCYFNLYKNFI